MKEETKIALEILVGFGLMSLPWFLLGWKVGVVAITVTLGIALFLDGGKRQSILSTKEAQAEQNQLQALLKGMQEKKIEPISKNLN